jgi:hypothetical protein
VDEWTAKRERLGIIPQPREEKFAGALTLDEIREEEEPE